MKIAIIGAGSIGMRHLKNALALGCEVFVTDVDLDRVRAAVALGAKYFDLKSFGPGDIYPSIDAMMVCTPYDAHLRWAQWALQDRIPLFVEKPLGSLDQIEDWRRLVKASEGQISQVGYQCRFHPKARAMKLLFPKPTSGFFECSFDMAGWPGQSYGPWLLEASHDLDLALWFGAPNESPNIAKMSDGMWVRFGSDWGVLFKHPAEYFRSWSVGYGYDDDGVKVAFGSPKELGDQMYVDELKHFLGCVQGGRQTDVPLSDGLRVLEVCQQIEAMSAKMNGAQRC